MVVTLRFPSYLNGTKRTYHWPRGLRRGSAAARFAGIVSLNPVRGVDVYLL